MGVLEKLTFKLYEFLPKKLIRAIGKSRILKPFRDTLLRKGKAYREIQVSIDKEYFGHHVVFQFVAPFKVAEKAKNKGIENTLLRNSLQLMHERGVEGDACLLDVGSNYGYLSMVWAIAACARGGRVFSFEPNPNSVAAFRNTIRINNLTDTIVSENVAVGSENGRVELFLRTTTSNLRSVPGSESSIMIDLMCIDDYMEKENIQKCDLIKIDVDGTEYEILLGAGKTIRRFSPILIIETNQDRRIIQFLIEQGYRIMDMNLDNIVADSLPINILCIKEGLVRK